jgi:hypothetical protein
MSMIANTANPTATFTAGRRELVGPDALLGTAEIARGVCHAANRRLGLLAITTERMRRVDGWLTHEALVTHPVAAGAGQPVVGAVCARRYAGDLVGSIIHAMVGPVPSAPATAPVDVAAIATLAPTNLPPGVSWMLVATSVAGSRIERWCVGDANGLVGAAIDDLATPVVLEPVGPIPNWARIARLLGDPATVTTEVTATPGAPS